MFLDESHPSPRARVRPRTTNNINLAKRMKFRLTGSLGEKRSEERSNENRLTGDEFVEEGRCRARLDQTGGR